MRVGRFTPAFALLLAALTFTVGEWLRQPPPVSPASGPPGRFSAERAGQLLGRLLQDRVPHPVGSAANKRVRERIEQFLTQNGIAYEIQRTWGCGAGFSRCARVENVIGRLPGDRPGPYVALMAHYDSVPMAPGAGDDGAGLTALLESARILKGEGSHRNPLLLVITDAEEMGLLGAEAFFGRHPLAKEVGVVLNLEGAGTTGASQVLRTQGDNGALMSFYRHAVPHPFANSLTDEIFKRMPNDTDFSVSRRAGVPGVDFAFAGEFTHYHTANDNLDNIDLRTLQHHGDNLLPLARVLLDTDLSRLRRDDDRMVYFQVLGLWVDWPTWANGVLLAIAALALAGAAIRGKVHRAGWRQLLLALGTPLLVMIFACAAGLAAFKSIEWLNGTMVSWPAILWPYRLVLFGAPALGAGAILLWLNRYLELMPALVGAWLWWWVAGLLATIYLPGGAGMFLSPLVVAAILLLAATVVESTAVRSGLVIATLVVAAAQMLGIVLPLEASQGYRIILATFPFLALFLVVLAPLMRGKTALSFSGVALLATVVGIGVAANSPRYSEWRPQQVNIQFVENVDSGYAYGFLSSQNPLPERMLSTMAFEDKEASVYPWTEWRPKQVASTAPSGWPAPELAVLADEVVDGSRTLELELKAIRPARLVQLVLPGEVDAETFSVDGIDVPVARVQWPPYKDRYVIALMGMNGNPVKVRLRLKNPAPFDAWLADVSTALPESMQPVLQARPPLAVAVHQGDTAMLIRSVRL